MALAASVSAACRRPAPVEAPYRVSVPYDLDSLDPAARNRLSDFSLLSNFYEPLVVTDANLSPRPALATRWNNPDPQTWVFELRRGVRFHDGRPLRAADVVWSFERLTGAGKGLEMSGHVSMLRRVRATGERTVEVVTTGPVGILLNKLRFILIVPEGEDVAGLSRRVVGTGPFRLESWEKGRSLTLRRNESYWGARPSLAEVRISLNRAPAEALGDLLSGRSDFVQSSSKETEEAIRARSGLELRRNSSVSVKFLSFGLESGRSDDVAGGRNPFVDPRVRRAVSLAVDRAALVRRLSAPAVPANQLVLPSIFGFDPALPALRYDPGEARRLLAEAGWPDGFDLRFPARGLFAEAAGVVAEMLARVGIRARVVALPEQEWFEMAYARRFAMTITRFGCPTGDASDLFEAALHTWQPERRLGLMNYSRYANPELDGVVESAGRTLEMGVRRGLLTEATALAMRDLPFVPLYVEQDLYAFRRGVEWKPRNDNFFIASEVLKPR